mmetsp:Transcript_25844/g.78082  ORF Transcript_25844/g.78082 Transcript_25844/m.78082 type:complete len:89 (+) Transcript_25844:44-310(+)
MSVCPAPARQARCHGDVLFFFELAGSAFTVYSARALFSPCRGYPGQETTAPQGCLVSPGLAAYQVALPGRGRPSARRGVFGRASRGLP